MEQLEIRDHRNKEWFWIDDEYLNGYARLLKPASTLVYLALCRHANTQQKSWPSIELLCEKLNLSKPTVISAIKELESWNIVYVTRSKDPETKRQNPNVYILTNKKVWKEKPGKDIKPGSKAESNSQQEPGKNDDEKPGKADLPELNTVISKHKELNTGANESPNEVNQLIEFFQQTINPHISYANKTERKACSDLISNYGLEKTKQAILFLEERKKTDRYLPVVTTPYELWNKWAKIKEHLTRQTTTGRTRKWL